MEPRRAPEQNLYRKFMTGLALVPSPEAVPGRPSTISDTLPLTKFELTSSRVASEEEGATECLQCLWPFLRLSRLIGMCPLVRRGNDLIVPNRIYSPAWVLTLVAIAVQSLMFSNAVKTLARSTGDTGQLVDAGNNCIYYSHTFCNGLYMSWKVRELPKFLVACKRVETLCKKYGGRRDGLVRDCLLLFSFFTGTQGIGNLLYYYSVADKNNVTTVGEFFHAFNDEFIGEWGSYYSGIFFSLGEFYCDMGWTFADMLLALLSLILSRYFARINWVLGKRGSGTLSMARIEELRCDHREVCHLVQHCNSLFSPLFLLTYVANVGYLFSRLYTGLQDDLKDPSVSVQVESLYAFCYQILVKMLLPSYLAARLNERAHEGLDLVHSWPSSVEGPDSKYRLLVIGRFVSQLVTTHVGISGCGYFIISKSFVVTLISALITYEVIILQFQAAAGPKPVE